MNVVILKADCGALSEKQRSGFQIFCERLARSKMAENCSASVRADNARLGLVYPCAKNARNAQKILQKV